MGGQAAEGAWLAERFEEHRGHLRAVAYRMLGSLPAADDAVQEAWVRFSNAGADGVENLGGWLTTIVARVCLNVLRARAALHAEKTRSVIDHGSVFISDNFRGRLPSLPRDCARSSP